MHSVVATRFPREKVMTVLHGIPLFPQLAAELPESIEPLLEHSRFIVAEPGETVICKGEFDSWFYFLLKGELAVSTGSEDATGKIVGYIKPGEMFGALAIVRDAERNASIQIAGNKRTILFGIDSAPFGELEDFSQVPLAVKILFLRYVAERTEAHLMAYDREMPGTDLTDRLKALPAFTLVAGALEELNYLNRRANALADLLAEWNLTLESIEDYEAPKPVVSGDLLDDLERLYFG